MRSWRLDRAVLRMALGAARHAADRIADRLAEQTGDPTFEDLVAIYVPLYDLTQELHAAMTVLDPYLVDLHPDRFRPYPLAGGGALRIRGGNSKVVFDNERLVSSLAKAITDAAGLQAIVTKDGEAGDAAVMIDGIARLMAKATGALAPSFNSWRSGVAKDLGIDLKRFSRKEVTSYRPNIEGRSPHAPAEDSADRTSERSEGDGSAAETA